MTENPKNSKKLIHIGTAFSVQFGSDSSCITFITCEHVIAKKDSLTKKTIGFHKRIYGQLNLDNDSTVSAELEIIYSNEIKDNAILQLKQPFASYLKNYKIHIQNAELSAIKDGDDLREGDYLLYMGYPMSFGVGRKSYPVARTGIVSQNIKDSSNFLVDGFVQGGYSGSPVYRIRIDQGRLEYKYFIVGMLQAYSFEPAVLNSKEKSRSFTSNVEVLTNPGFTIALKMKEIKKKLLIAQCIP